MGRHRYLRAIAENARTIGETAGSAPNEIVPSCPDWRLRDLAFHVGCVLAMWADVVHRASLERRPYGSGLTEPTDDRLEPFVLAQADALVEVLESATDETPAWNWWGDPTARWIPRRAAHETAIHAWDASNTIGTTIEIDTDLATDGIVEFFDVMMPFTGRPPTDIDGTLRLEATDVDAAWTVDLNTDHLPTVRPAQQDTDAIMRGTACELLLVLWRRLPQTHIAITGEQKLVERFLAYTNLG